MKTATIEVSHVLGTSYFQACVVYRGKTLKTFTRLDLEPWEPMSMLNVKAKSWAACNGFTHYKRTGDNFK